MNTFIQNKKFNKDYKKIEQYSAGIELFGFEVKSVKGKLGSLEGAHVTIRGGEAYLVGAFIPPYQSNNTPNDYDPYRNRRLLLNKNEIDELVGIEKQKGLTIVPISMYNKSNLIKLDIAVVSGKKKHDKREDIKRKDTSRDVEREFKTKLR